MVLLASATAHVAAESSRNYGGTYDLVKRMYDNDRFRGWTYTPFLGGFLFSMATILLRKNPEAMLAVQGSIGLGTVAMANGVATSAIVKERSHK